MKLAKMPQEKSPPRHYHAAFRGAHKREPGIQAFAAARVWIPGSVLRTAPE
jgi:hypothetical protein